MIYNMTYKFKPIDIIIIILVIVLVFLFYNKTEHLTTLSNESLQNLSSVYNINTLAVTNANVTGNLSVNGSFNLLPTGSIIMWNGSTAPTGWLLCDGTNGTPDLRGKFVLGSGNGTGLTSRKLGDNGGEENHVLTVKEIPSHFHRYYDAFYTENTNNAYSIYDKNGSLVKTYDDQFGGKNKHSGSSGGNDNDNTMWTELVGTSGDIGIPGKGISTSDGSHNNMPPYYVLTYIMKS